MLTVHLPPDIQTRIISALQRAGRNEIGGILMAEHTAKNNFTVREVTIQRRGTVARFVRHVEEAVTGIRDFFRKTGHDYTKFNYLGEWHSHPLFPAEPSSKDDSSMREIVQDSKVGAQFAVLLILKLDASGSISGTAHTYLPDITKGRSELSFERVQ